MADIDKISVNNTTYNIKDSTARDSISHITYQDSDLASVVVFDIGSSNNKLRIWYNKADSRLHAGIKLGSNSWRRLVIGQFEE